MSQSRRLEKVESDRKDKAKFKWQVSDLYYFHTKTEQ